MDSYLKHNECNTTKGYGIIRSINVNKDIDQTFKKISEIWSDKYLFRSAAVLLGPTHHNTTTRRKEISMYALSLGQLCFIKAPASNLFTTLFQYGRAHYRSLFYLFISFFKFTQYLNNKYFILFSVLFYSFHGISCDSCPRARTKHA